MPVALIQALQVATVAAAGPLLAGTTARVEARMQGRVGPRVLQPYYDIVKAFGKETLLPEGAGAMFLLAPVAALACYLAVPMMIPVLTSYPLPFAYTGDILGGGMVLAFGSFLTSLAANESGGVYAQLGSSRAKTFAAFTEPAVLLVVFTVAMVTATDLPYAMAAAVTSGPDQILRPAHLLASAALFLVILYETGRIPVESHGGTIEFGMIESARSFEHSGPFWAMSMWASDAKQFVLYVLFIDVFIAPWGLASTKALLAVAIAIVAIVAKSVGVGVFVAAIDNTYAKLRLFKNAEFVAAAFLLSVIAVFTLFVAGG